MEPRITSFGPNTVIIDALLAKMRATEPSVQTGPGRRTLHTYHKQGRKRYTGDRLRATRRERGVGRLPGTVATQAQIDNAMLTLTNAQRNAFYELNCLYGGDLVKLRASSSWKGNVWKKFVQKLDSLGMIEPGQGGFYRVSRFGRECHAKFEGAA